jgi:very-short-patch-repair endonuclease
MAAVLAFGSRAVLSHRPAAAHWELLRWSGAPEITTATRGLRSRNGVRVHSTVLPPDEVTVHRGIPITTVPRTLFDIAAHVPVRLLERAINEAEVRRLWDELSLDALLRRYPRHSGNKVVRAALHKRRQGETFTKSDLEEAFLQLVDELRLARPQVNVMVEGLEVDAVWHGQRIVVELDARSTHATIEAFERDREKDRILQVANWHPIRVTARQLTIGRASLIADLKRLLADTV